MKKKILLVVLATLLCAQSVSAQFGFGGFGEIVYDPISYANAVLMYLQLIKSVDELELQYELAAQMAKIVPVDMATRYRAPTTPWLPTQPPTDRYGKLTGWTGVINGGGSALGAYSQATEFLDEYGSLIDQYSLEGQEHLKLRYSSVEMADGANLNGIQTLGELRGKSEGVAKTIAALENDSLSANPGMNTEIAVLNKLGAASILHLRNTDDTNKLLGAMLEQQLAASKRERDAAVRELNAHILRLREGARVWEQHTSTLEESMRNMRLH